MPSDFNQPEWTRLISAVRPLEALWRCHVAALGCLDSRKAMTLFGSLCTSYSRPPRAYHTLAHLIQLFDRLEGCASLTRDPLRLAFAAWYHDIVYDPRANDNEARSAERARIEMMELGAAAGLVERVSSLILSTMNHAKGGSDFDDELFLDADFSILGVEAGAYEAYAAQIRLEYSHLSDDQWRSGRGQFLQAAVAQSRTFRTDMFEVQFGPQARVNMAAELRTLTVGHGGRAPLS